MLLFALLLFASSIASDYVGCFKDNTEEQRDLPILQTDESDEPAPLSVESCVLMCAADNWPYAGLQKGAQCFCGASYGSQGNASDPECRTKCPGDEETDDSKRNWCGGENRNSIYTTGATLDAFEEEKPVDGIVIPSLSSGSAEEPQKPVVDLNSGVTPTLQVLCPVCPYKKQECGGPTRGNCNRRTGNCECVNGWAGGACGGRNGRVGAAAYGIRPPSGQPPAPAKCPVCPYKKEECGGPTRGECNRQTAECVCKAPWSGGACSNRNGRPGAAGYNVGNRPAPRPAGNNYQNVKCPVCPYRHAECGGPNRGDCNKQTGECVCKPGYSGGACSNHGGRIGAAAYQTGKSTGGPNNNKCPICPYKRNECGGPERGVCNRQTGECKCINGWSGGACSGRNGQIGIAAYNRATLAEGANYSSNGSDNRMWITAVAVLGTVVLVLFVAVIALVVKLNSREEERM